MCIKKGTVVIATAGREKNKFFVVSNVSKEKSFIVNGKNRTLEKPKCKNNLHLKKTNISFDINSDVTDKQIRKFLNDFSNS